MKETLLEPTVEEMSDRLARVRARMDQEGIEAYVAFSPDNVFYLTNFANYVHERPFVLVVRASGPLAFVVPKLEVPHVKARTVGKVELIEYAEFPAPAGVRWDEMLRSGLPEKGRVGIETVCQVQIAHAISNETTVTDVIDEVRWKKSDYEIARIAYNCRLFSEVHNDMLFAARPGTLLSTFMGEARARIMGQALADNPAINPFATNFIAGFQNQHVSDDPHNYSDMSLPMVEGGPHVTAFTGKLAGYGAEIERTFFVGHMPEAAKRPWDAMMDARHLMQGRIRPGLGMGDLDREVKALFRKHGYEGNLLHRVGHGLGVTGHEAPFFADGCEYPIEPGMVFSLEPGIYFEGAGGYRHSDTILTTEDGFISLSNCPDDLESMIIEV